MRAYSPAPERYTHVPASAVWTWPGVSDSGAAESHPLGFGSVPLLHAASTVRNPITVRPNAPRTRGASIDLLRVLEMHARRSKGVSRKRQNAMSSRRLTAQWQD